MCRCLGVSTSGYYAWRSRPTSTRALADAVLTEVIKAVHADSRRTYGAPRVHAELRLGHGIRCGQKRVARLMRACGLQGVHRRKGFRTTRRDESPAPAPDLLGRDFRAAEPDRKWVADITYVLTWSGFLYLAALTVKCSPGVDTRHEEAAQGHKGGEPRAVPSAHHRGVPLNQPVRHRAGLRGGGKGGSQGSHGRNLST